MKDRWINMGYEESELKPYKEPSKDVLDQGRIGKLPKLLDPSFFLCFMYTCFAFVLWPHLYYPYYVRMKSVNCCNCYRQK